MREEAQRRIGHLYPEVEVTPEMVRERSDLRPYLGRKLTVIAWLWARTVRSPNPAFRDAEVPLASTWMLSTKKGKEAYVEPVIEGREYRFRVRVGSPPDLRSAKAGTKIARGSFRCLFSGAPVPYAYIDDEANRARMRERLMAIVAQGNRTRVYLSPTAAMEALPATATPLWKPDLPSRGTWASNAQGRRYGFWTFGDYFTPRQLVALTTFSDLVGEAMQRIERDASAAGMPDDNRPLRDGGTGARAYAEAVAVYLGFAVDKCADYWSTICTWHVSKALIRNTFGRQAIPMTWDYSEANPLGQSTGNWIAMLDWVRKSLGVTPCRNRGAASQRDASSQRWSVSRVVSTDPPYYDNIGYADLSDFFYTWLRRSLRPVFPELFGTLAVPKVEELVATPYRHGTKAAAESFFLDGMTRALNRLSRQAHPGFPVTVYYAFKQSETKGDTGTASTGWETFLDAAITSGFAITGTWPIRTELANRMISKGTNALASSIVLVCRRRPTTAPIATRREFLTALRSELPPALHLLQSGNIAPVDLAPGRHRARNGGIHPLREGPPYTRLSPKILASAVRHRVVGMATSRLTNQTRHSLGRAHRLVLLP